MYTTSIFIVISVNMLLANSVSVNRYSEITNNIASIKSRMAVQQVLIKCEMNDILVITSPMILNSGEVLYFLTNPKGVTVKQNITRPGNFKINEIDIDEYDDNIRVKFVNDKKTVVITSTKSYKVYNANKNMVQNSEADIFEELTKKMKANDFIVGPLGYEDYGNWEISLYYKDDHDDWLEVFQVIEVLIYERVPANQFRPKLKPGATFRPSIAYPITEEHSCELVVPRYTFDRFYESNPLNLASCAYLVKNVTRADSGFWTIIAVGRIVYRTSILLIVDEKF